MTATRTSRRGFTLVEGLVAAAVGAVVIGGAMVLYHQGHKAFLATTEHASFREEALLILETIGKDLEGLVVSDQLNPDTNIYYMVQPFDCTDPVQQENVDPKTGEKQTFSVPSGMKFYKYHHTTSGDGNTADSTRTCQIVGQQIVYKSELIDQAKPERGMNLLRNGKRVNTMPLSGVLFEPLDPIIAAKNLGASPNAIIQVTIVPNGGVWGKMTPSTIQTLRNSGKVCTRVYHLAEYESQYTTMLWCAMVKNQAGIKTDPMEQAVLDYGNAIPNNMAGKLREKIKELGEQGYRLDENQVLLEPKLYDEATAGSDPTFATATLENGLGPESSSVIGSGKFGTKGPGIGGQQTGPSGGAAGLLGN
jgi:hypothetical protein